MTDAGFPATGLIGGMWKEMRVVKTQDLSAGLDLLFVLVPPRPHHKERSRRIVAEMQVSVVAAILKTKLGRIFLTDRGALFGAQLKDIGVASFFKKIMPLDVGLDLLLDAVLARSKGRSRWRRGRRR